MKQTYVVLMLALLIGLASCDTKRVYQQAYDFDDTGWHMDTIPAFTFEIGDTAPKNLLLNLRYGLDYKDYNIYLTYHLEDSTGTKLSSELINLNLFDPTTGRPLGEGSSIYQSQQAILEVYRFPGPGTYTFRIAQYMRYASLEEVYSVGLRVEEAGE
jgi:gliding motility-associated lipoprotein GldH